LFWDVAVPTVPTFLGVKKNEGFMEIEAYLKENGIDVKRGMFLFKNIFVGKHNV
jgi:hypothetical protein